MRITRKRLAVGAISLVALAGLVFGGYVAWKNWRGVKGDRYGVVYLTSGEIYIGRLSLFPRVSMVNPYMLQIIADEKDRTKTTPQLVPLADTVWSPRKLYINRDRIVFYASMKDESEAAQALAAKEAERAKGEEKK